MKKKSKQVRLVSVVIASQNGSSEESDSMDLSSVDFSLKTMEKCKHFDAETYELHVCTEPLNSFYL